MAYVVLSEPATYNCYCTIF